MVPGGRLELPRLSAAASKTAKSTIPSPGHNTTYSLALLYENFTVSSIRCFTIIDSKSSQLSAFDAQHPQMQSGLLK